MMPSGATRSLTGVVATTFFIMESLLEELAKIGVLIYRKHAILKGF